VSAMDSSCSIGAGDGRQGKRTLVSGERLRRAFARANAAWASLVGAS